MAVGAVGVLGPLLLALLAGPPAAPLGQGQGEQPRVPLLGVAVGGKPGPAPERGGESRSHRAQLGLMLVVGTAGAHLGGGQWEWGGLARQGDALGGTAGGCGSAGAAGAGRSGSGSFLTGLFSFGDSRRELAFSSATSTSKSLARPCTSRRWCTEWICGTGGGHTRWGTPSGRHRVPPPRAAEALPCRSAGGCRSSWCRGSARRTACSGRTPSLRAERGSGMPGGLRGARG